MRQQQVLPLNVKQLLVVLMASLVGRAPELDFALLSVEDAPHYHALLRRSHHQAHLAFQWENQGPTLSSKADCYLLNHLVER